MKFAFIADIHLSRYSQDKVEHESGLPERLYSIRNALNEIGNYCYENDVGRIIIGGDIYHGKSIIHVLAQDIMLDFFDQYEGIEFWVLDGNHDISGKGTGARSALRPIINYPNVEWITQNPTQDIPEGLICIPYSHNVADQVKENKAKILISHFGLNEGVLNSGISIVADIKLSDMIGKYDLVLLGHYHKPQEIIRDDINLYYVGSLIQLDWGEKGDEKRFLVVDTDTLQVDSIPLTQYKKHIEIELTNDNKDEAIKAAQEAKENGHHVKFLMKEKVDLVDIKNDFHIVDKTEKDITDRGITSSMTQEDKITRYLEIKEIPESKRDIYSEEAFDAIRSCGGD